MRRIVFIQMLLLISVDLFGQTKSVNLKEIQKVANSKSYEQLFSRYVANDTTLSLEDYIVLYYGQAFREHYKPNARHDSTRALNAYLNNSEDSLDFRKVINYTHEILSDFPFNINHVFITGIAYENLGILDSSSIYLFKYDNLIRAIMASGNGKSPKTAFIVAKIEDEYSIIHAFRLQFTGQALIQEKKKSYDLMSVEQNEFGIDELYFDIDLFFGKW